MNWKPCAWAIPSDDDLATIERLLTKPQLRDFADHAQVNKCVRWCFSASAIFNHVLRRLKLATRKHLRSVVLDEYCKSVGGPAVHAEGLIGFCIENPKLEVLMRAGFSGNLVPSVWTLPEFDGSVSRSAFSAPVHTYLCIRVDWMIRIAMLPSHGMPQGAFRDLLEARSEDGIGIWKTVEQTAAAR